jgi:predicted nucleotidyltransferase
VNYSKTVITLKTLVQDLSVRNYQMSLVSVFQNFHLLPSEIGNQVQGYFDPLWSFCITPKYSLFDAEKTTSKYSYSRLHSLQFDSFGISSVMTRIEKGPFEFTTPFNNFWFHRLSTLFREIDFLKKVPGVMNVYITGSIITSSYKNKGDADLIIETKKNYVWFVRFIVKILLKLLGKDVHSYRGQLLVSMSEKPNLQKILPSKWIVQIRKYGLNMIQKEKHKINNIDVGMIFETGYDISHHYFNESQNWGILNPYLYHQDGYLEQVNLIKFGGENHLSSLNIFEKITYPIALLAQLLSSRKKTRHSSTQYFAINSRIVSFFPKIYKR